MRSKGPEETKCERARSPLPLRLSCGSLSDPGETTARPTVSIEPDLRRPQLPLLRLPGSCEHGMHRSTRRFTSVCISGESRIGTQKHTITKATEKS